MFKQTFDKKLENLKAIEYFKSNLFKSKGFMNPTCSIPRGTTRCLMRFLAKRVF